MSAPPIAEEGWGVARIGRADPKITKALQSFRRSPRHPVVDLGVNSQCADFGVKAGASEHPLIVMRWDDDQVGHRASATITIRQALDLEHREQDI